MTTSSHGFVASHESDRESLTEQSMAVHQTFSQEPDWQDQEIAACGRAWTRSHLQQSDIEAVLKLAKAVRQNFRVLVTVGIGGSDLTARVFHDTLNHSEHNWLSRAAPEVYFTGDTFDPRRLKGLLEMLSTRGLLGQTAFNVISKSGKTGETISALMIIREELRKQGVADDPEAWRNQVVATTGLNQESVLYQLHCERPFFGEQPLSVPVGVGGRFSAFSPVGLFFLAATADQDEAVEPRVRSLLEGVALADEQFRQSAKSPDSIAFQLAAWLQSCEHDAGLGTLVFYNYADLNALGDWFVQLYEESIVERGAGLNVVSARGPTSNHSLLNGIVRGPSDKTVLFVHWRDLGHRLKIPVGTGIKGDLEALEGLTMNQVQTASYLGTAEDLTENLVPHATIEIPQRNAFHLGWLMRTLMDAVAIKGRLQGLHQDEAGNVNLPDELTYLQHGVEGYKQRTRELARQMQAVALGSQQGI